MDGTTAESVSSAPTTGTMSAADALAAADTSAASSAASPESSSTPTDQPASATASPEGQTETPVTASTPGEPPKWRWQDILENTRQKTAKETEERLRGEFGPFASMSAEERTGLLTWQRALAGDPQARTVISQAAQSDPALAHALRGLMGEPARPQTQHTAQPSFLVQQPDGTLAFDPDAFQQWNDWNAGRIRAELTKEIDPLRNVVRDVATEREHARAYQTVSQTLNAFRNDPEFKANEAGVKTVLQNDPTLLDLAESNPKLALEVAWLRFRAETLEPQQRQSTEQRVLASLQQKAASSTVNPATAASTAPKSTIGNARAALMAAGVGE